MSSKKLHSDSDASAEMASALRAAEIMGTVIDHYVLTHEVGTGGFGRVYAAVDISSAGVGRQQSVAIKVLLKHLARNPDAIAAFKNEVDCIERLRHPNIVGILGQGSSGGLPYFVMPLVEGVTLARAISERRLSIADAVRLVAQIADAVAYSNEAGVLHRDIKPTNIILRDQDAVPILLDFGLAKQSIRSGQMSASEKIVGTEPYMAPEQLDPRLGFTQTGIDQYALGVVLYEILAGRRPFPLKDGRFADLEIGHQIAHVDPPPPSLFNSNVPSALDTVCLMCLQKSPLDRYENVADLRDDLQRIMDGEPIRGKLPSLARRTRRIVKRNPGWSTAVGIGALLAAVGATASHYYSTKASETFSKLDVAESTARDAKTSEATAINQRIFQEYVAEMKTLPSLWTAGDVSGMRAVLDRHGKTTLDQRGFEWYYWSHVLRNQNRIMKERVIDASKLAISHTSSHIGVCGERRVVIFDTKTGLAAHSWSRLTAPTDEAGDRTMQLSAIAFSPSGDFFAAVEGESRSETSQQAKAIRSLLRVWRVVDGFEVLRVESDSRVSGGTVEFTPDGKSVVAGGYVGHWQSWSITDARVGPGSVKPKDDQIIELHRFAKLEGKNAPVTSLRVEPGTILTESAGSQSRLATAWRWPSGESDRDIQARFTKADGFVSAAAEPGLSVSLDEGTVLLVREFRPKLGYSRERGTFTLAAPAKTRCMTVAANVDDTELITGDEDFIVRRWHVRPPKPDMVLSVVLDKQYKGARAPIRVVAANHSAVACVDEEGSVYIWPIDGVNESESVDLPAASLDPAPGPSTCVIIGATTVSGRMDEDGESFIVQDASRGSRVSIPIGDHIVTRAVTSPDQRFVALCTHPKLLPENFGRLGNPRVTVWDLHRAKQVASTIADTPFIFSDISFTRDGLKLLIPSYNDGIRALNLQTESVSHICTGMPVLKAKLSPSGVYIAVSGVDSIGVWNTSEEKWILRATGLSDSFAFNDDESRLVAGGTNSRVIELPSARELPSLLRNLAESQCVLSGDGRRMFAVKGTRLQIYAMDSDDGTLLLDAHLQQTLDDTAGLEDRLAMLSKKYRIGE